MFSCNLFRLSRASRIGMLLVRHTILYEIENFTLQWILNSMLIYYLVNYEDYMIIESTSNNIT